MLSALWYVDQARKRRMRRRLDDEMSLVEQARRKRFLLWDRYCRRCLAWGAVIALVGCLVGAALHAFFRWLR